MSEQAKAQKDIVDRLRDKDAFVMAGLFYAVPTMREAADIIVTLREWVTRLERQNVDMQNEIDQLEAQIPAPAPE